MQLAAGLRLPVQLSVLEILTKLNLISCMLYKNLKLTKFLIFFYHKF